MMEQGQIIETPLRVIAICGSLRSGSTMLAALRVALAGAQALGAETQLIDLRDYELIFCDGKRNERDYPDDVVNLRRMVQGAHGIIWGTPEYHGGPSGVLKNALDLMGFDEFQGKVIGLVGTSGGEMGAPTRSTACGPLAGLSGPGKSPSRAQFQVPGRCLAVQANLKRQR
jgi:NAD(P)H-dependent FMN reductase